MLTLKCQIEIRSKSTKKTVRFDYANSIEVKTSCNSLTDTAVLKLPPLWVYFLLCTDEFVKWPWVLSHYKSRKWLKNITRDDLFAEEPAT